ncbi:MAG: helix-turn-helix domain-containing protein [bacterium]|nr:helix-turn-helix domain-containing protein [bacterium]
MKSLGQMLREQREKKNITLEMAESVTKIRKSYLVSLEDSKYDELPAATYIKGFLTIYSEYLGLAKDDVFAFFRREFDESKDGKVVPKSSLSPVHEPLIRFSPQVFFTSCFVCAIAVLFAYLWVQYQAYAAAPMVELYSPKDGLVTQKADLDVEGKVTVDSKLTLNGQNIELSQDGYFKRSIQLEEAANVLTFVAVNDAGKSTTVKRTVRLDVVR